MFGSKPDAYPSGAPIRDSHFASKYKTCMEKLVKNKCSNLFGLFISDKGKKG
jgi:hypothetical protein